MNRILVDVFCPATSKSYDFWLPKKMTVAKAVEKICEDICAFENNTGLFGAPECTFLSSYLGGRALPAQDTLEAAGVKSGDKLAVL